MIPANQVIPIPMPGRGAVNPRSGSCHRFL